MTAESSRHLAIPELSLVALVGVSGSGKSTFATEHFGPFEVISSDYCRGLVSDDVNDQDATAAAFEVLDFIAGKRLEAGRLTVIDATNVQSHARRSLVTLAKSHDVLPVAIVFDLPVEVAVERNSLRPDRDFAAGVIRRQHSTLRPAIKRLQKEGFRTVHVLHDPEEVATVQIVREPLYNNRCSEHGPFDAIGDVHGCLSELLTLLKKLDYQVAVDAQGRAVDASHPEGRKVIFLGDLVDRGPDSPGVLRLAMGMQRAGHALVVPGNHESKLVRALRGAKVQVSHGLAETLAQLAKEDAGFRDEVAQWCHDLVSHLVLDDGKLVIAHAGLKEEYHGRTSGRVRSFALYGDSTGETDEFGLPIRYPWAHDYRGKAMVLYGHTPTPNAEWVNNTMCLDTGCVFGGYLSALRYPEKELVSVPAEQVWYEPAKPFPVASDSGGLSHLGAGDLALRDPDQLDITDVLGRRSVETAFTGRLTIGEDYAAGALEVMSRFALHPRWLRYLPPTMAPVDASPRPEVLEHPDEAFKSFSSQLVDKVICEEKHMGSRAVALICRDEEVAARRFGAIAGESGVVYTRTGREFFDGHESTEIVAGLRDALTRASIWEELETDWVLLDGELLPWSAKAEALLRTQYAPVGAASRASLPAAVVALRQTQANGIDVSALLARTEKREQNASAYTEAYRRYCWQVDGMKGIRYAPFQILASEGNSWHDRDHGWHMTWADRLVTANPELIQPTRRLEVDTSSLESWEAGVRWWEEITAAGGEGMVVKPWANLTRAKRGLVQPGLKVRGREYLRIIYGPDYTEPDNIARLRTRNVAKKRSLALREYSLGLEAIRRTVAMEPLWRVHEAVFAILALESEPIDPRL